MFIVFEGIDGSGKTTQAKLLFESLRRQGVNVLYTIEPMDSDIGMLIKKRLSHVDKDNIGADEELSLLFAANRAQHLRQELRPALADGKTVICDRYIYSSLVYRQPHITKSWIKIVNQHDLYVYPDIIFFIDVSAAEAINRCVKRGGLDKMENLSFLRKVSMQYRDIIAKEACDVVLVAGDREPDVVHDDILEEYGRLLWS